jgi:pimeloyl-ACP methyl ester carboxylesterase
MATKRYIPTGLLRACPFAALLLSIGTAPLPAQATPPSPDWIGTAVEIAHAAKPHKVTIRYTTHDGHARRAHVLLPAGYDSGRNPAIPLVISAHGRAVTGEINTRRWGNLPTLGRFAVVNPDGFGRKLPLHSWGYTGQIDDLARMADIVEAKLPWVHLDRTRIYAIGASMGAQETLLLAGRYPELLAGAVAVDGPADFAMQYRNFPRLKCSAGCLARGWGAIGPAKQRLARQEIGGTPRTAPALYAERSPLTYASRIATACVPVQLWWSRTDEIVLDADRQSGRMLSALKASNPHAPVEGFVGEWLHTDVMRHETDLPRMLARLGLLPSRFDIERMRAADVEGSSAAGGACADQAPSSSP